MNTSSAPARIAAFMLSKLPAGAMIFMILPRLFTFSLSISFHSFLDLIRLISRIAKVEQNAFRNYFGIFLKISSGR
ncbi:MAG: hypothetical protein IJF17_05240, partial [Thermoguttaceae bacterium]|nr:hypothetical protein [Thermoguttaceae bacterium]